MKSSSKRSRFVHGVTVTDLVFSTQAQALDSFKERVWGKQSDRAGGRPRERQRR